LRCMRLFGSFDPPLGCGIVQDHASLAIHVGIAPLQRFGMRVKVTI
jgi:hypothetical protein